MSAAATFEPELDSSRVASTSGAHAITQGLTRRAEPTPYPRIDSTCGATSTYHSPPSVKGDLTLQYNDRAPSFERLVVRALPGTCSGQVLPRHTRGSPYRCSL